MANLAVTASQVKLISGTPIDGLAGEAIIVGQACYLKQTDGRWYLAQADGTAEEAGLYGYGIAVSSAPSGSTSTTAYSPVKIAGPGCVVDLGAGAAAAASSVYALSATYGSIAAVADIVASASYRVPAFVGRGSNQVGVIDRAYPGAAIP